MFRSILLVFVTGLLSACAQLPGLAGLLAPAPAKPSSAETGHYSFAWRLSGDREVAPLQVFDNGEQTWLQFPIGHTVPAIFQRSATGDKLLTYQRQGPYVILPGVWPSLVLRGGSLQSRVDRIVDRNSDGDLSGNLTQEPFPHEPVVSVPALALATDIVEAVASPALSATELTLASFSDIMTDTALPAASPMPHESPASDPVTTIALGDRNFIHSVSPQDKNIRSALMRWANAAGWTFEPEHWAVDADIPIVGSATFGSHFKLAVQDLVASTELADRPLQPCFYSNQVLRIVPYAQTCDRSAGVVAS